MFPYRYNGDDHGHIYNARQCRRFVEVVNSGSFTRAARRLGMPATTVSARIKRLQERLRTALLLRTTRRLRLTEAGERYFDTAPRRLMFCRGRMRYREYNGGAAWAIACHGSG